MKDIRYTILGAARSGIAAASFLRSIGKRVFLSEAKAQKHIPESNTLKEICPCEFGGHTSAALNADCIIVSPGIPQDIPVLKRARKMGIECISEIELGYRHLHSSIEIVAVTGTNGKSTTTSLISHLLNACGIPAVAAGNIGNAFTSLPIERPFTRVVVLELSSFQLELVPTFKPDVALLLNITPDHLNRYTSMDEYARTKFNIFSNQDRSDLAIINGDDGYIEKLRDTIHSGINTFSLNKKADGYHQDGRLCFDQIPGDVPVSDTALRGPHNIANMLAAVLAVLRFTPDLDAIRNGLGTFPPLAHRLEPVGEINGVHFVNDSKATNTDAVRFALQSFDVPLRIILGGSDKGEDFRVLIPDLRRHAKEAFLIGETTPKMLQDLKDSVPLHVCQTLQDAVHEAYQASSDGSVVLLAPACASFDMFKNFEDRGNRFRSIVDRLKLMEES